MTRIKKEKGLPMACPNCGQPTIEGAKFCASCGSPLTQTTAAAPQAPAAPESDDGTMLSSAPHMAPAPQMPTAAVPLPNSAAPAAPQTTVPQPTTPQPATQAQPTAQAQATQTVAPQAAPTQQFQYAPSPAPQPAAAPQPSQPTQQIARPAADPTITALTTPQSMKTMGASLGIGLGASVVFALLASIVFFMGNAAASNGLAGIPGFSDTASFLGNNGVSGSGPNFFQILFTVMTLGVGGSLNLKTSSQGFSLSNLGIDASHVSVTLPIGLPGVALAIGAAFGAYMLARRFALRFKWTGVISSLIVGVLSGLVLLVFAAIFPVTVGGSYSDYSASASLSGVSFRTFCMAFLLSVAGALAGYALAQYAGDSGNVFSAAWRWAHRARGFVRTLVESFAIYGVLFLVLGLVATIAMSAANHLGAGGLLLVPLLFPALPLMLISLSSFGGIAFSTSSYSVHTITLFNVSSLSQYGWILWICFVLFLLATFYIALRKTARNMYDPYYAGWQHTWKAPVAAMVFWLAAEFLFTYFAAGYASSSMSMTAPMWYFLVAGIWAFLIEGGRDDVRSDAGGVPAGHVADHRRWHRAADPAERGRLRQVLRSVLRHEEDLCHGERHDRNSDHADGFGCRTAGQSNYSGSSGRIGPPARDAGCADARAHRSYRNACFTGRSTTGRPDVHAQYDNGQHGNGQHGNGCGAVAAIASRRGFYAGRSSGGRSAARPKN